MKKEELQVVKDIKRDAKRQRELIKRMYKSPETQRAILSALDAWEKRMIKKMIERERRDEERAKRILEEINREEFVRTQCAVGKHAWVPIRGRFRDSVCNMCGEFKLREEPEVIPFSWFDNIRGKDGNIIPIEERLGEKGEEAKKRLMRAFISLETEKFSGVKRDIIDLTKKEKTSREIAEMLSKKYGRKMTPENIRKIKQMIREEISHFE